MPIDVEIVVASSPPSPICCVSPPLCSPVLHKPYTPPPRSLNPSVITHYACRQATSIEWINLLNRSILNWTIQTHTYTPFDVVASDDNNQDNLCSTSVVNQSIICIVGYKIREIWVFLMKTLKLGLSRFADFSEWCLQEFRCQSHNVITFLPQQRHRSMIKYDFGFGILGKSNFLVYFTIRWCFFLILSSFELESQVDRMPILWCNSRPVSFNFGNTNVSNNGVYSYSLMDIVNLYSGLLVLIASIH
ncbi:unnamed protein product [Lactuca virosa]|uniref:Uncharacterized protein n=1 Tax=Lactuca virosa TaxID=75947 RepID=A0AAU9MJP0_9ASTR|nr:unnamed protein product [Lactuca virosa]